MPLEGYEAYNVENWDGYNADPITPETLGFAQKIAALIEQKPDDAPGGDGSVCWEWRTGEDILCLDVQKDGDFRVYGRIGGKFYHLRTTPDQS
jgi:hypothetical protein